MPRGPDKRPRKRKTLTPACYGFRKKRPAWETEENLRRVILAPALRYLQVCLSYYRQRKTYREISAETGIAQDQLPFMTQRVRRAMSVKPEPKTEVVGSLPSWRRGEEWQDGHVVRKDQRGDRKETSIPAMNNDNLLRKVILTRALLDLELARAFWIENCTLMDLTRRFGLSKSTLGLRLWRIQREIEHPKDRRHRRPVHLTRFG